MDDLISEFLAETGESLGMLDSELVRLEQNPNDTEILSNIFRLVHTIKGTCGFLGLPRLESVAHAGENVLGRIRDGEMEVTPEAVSIILEALDAIKAIMDYLADNGAEPEGNDRDLINRLNSFAEHGTAAGAAPKEEAKAPELAKEEPAEKKAEEAEANTVTMDELEAAWLAAEGPDDAPAAPQEAASSPEEKEEALPVATEESPPKEEEAEKPAALSPQARKEAIKKGLDVTSQREIASPNMANQTIRVNLDVLENLMSMVGELVLTRNQLMQIVRTKDDNDFKSPLQRLSYITTELQEGIMKTRMQPIGNAWAKFPRLIRDLSLELGKKIELRMEGAETELDRQLLEMIKDPLTHMVRNSCDHGLEMPDERRATGKDETGTVTLSAYHEGGHIIIDISDNGKGVNITRIKEKALQNGMTSSDELSQMSDQQIIQFIFRPGFSTAEKVTSVSGRGVGMDVVRTNIEKIGGTVELDSTPGKGSTFHIKIPLTLAIVSVLIVEADGQRFALPQINVQELVRTGAASDYKIETINESPVLRLRDKLLPVISLTKALKVGQNKSKSSQFVVVCKVGATDFGLLVDNIFDTEEIVVKPVSRLLQSIPIYSGNTVLGDGSVIMILDPNGIVRMSGGELDMGNQEDKDTHSSSGLAARTAPFLLFKSGGGGPKAVPLELVSRLEEIEVDQIESSNGRRVVQYRSDLMVLTTVRDMEIPAEGCCEVIVFHYDNKTVGLVVDEILDIVNAEPTVKLTSDDRMFLGTIVMNGKSTDVLDVGHLLSKELDIRLDLEALEITQQEVQEIDILFVEDSMFFRNLTVPFLSAVGYRVTAVSSAHDALYQLSKRQFDIIVTDIEMPEMDGLELAETVRTMANHREVPIIAFTSTANEGFDEQIRASGINNYVLKTEREKLITVITESLSNEKEVVE